MGDGDINIGPIPWIPLDSSGSGEAGENDDIDPILFMAGANQSYYCVPWNSTFDIMHPYALEDMTTGGWSVGVKLQAKRAGLLPHSSHYTGNIIKTELA